MSKLLPDLYPNTNHIDAYRFTMNSFTSYIIALCGIITGLSYTDSFTLTSKSSITFSPFHTPKRVIKVLPPLHLADELQSEPIAVSINTTLTDDNTEKLFAWIKCAFDYNEDDKDDVYAYYYNNIELAIAAAFGDNLPDDSLPAKLLQMAMKKEGLLKEDKSSEEEKEWKAKLAGDPIGRRERESASMGAMGAAQWTGQWMTRPHSLLDVRNFTSVDDWIKTLPRGCKRTLKKATSEAQNFTVITKPIRGGEAAPHSSYAHFRCVVQHEVRLLSNRYGNTPNAFINALAEGIGRYQGTTRKVRVRVLFCNRIQSISDLDALFGLHSPLFDCFCKLHVLT